MRKRTVIVAVVAFVVATASAVVLVQGRADAAPCTGGTYNYRQERAGACAWGNVQVWAAQRMRLDAVVRDTAADGVCARIEVQEVRSLNPDATVFTVKACGKGTSRPVQAELGFHGSIPGFTEGWRIRVCAKSCGPRTFYSSGSNVAWGVRP